MEKFNQKWKKIALGEILKLKSGISRPQDIVNKPDLTSFVPVYGGNGVLGYTKHIFSKERLLVIGRVGEYCGCVHIAESPNWITDNALYSEKWFDNTVNIDFLAIYLSYLNLNSFQRKAGQPLVTQGVLHNIEIILPTLPEQQAIARALRAIQQAKEARQRELELERERKAALMDYLFTHGTRGEKLKQTEIGEMPESWEVVKLKQFASVQGGYAFKSADYTINGIPLFKISNVSFSRVSWDDISFLPKEYIFKYREYSLKPGDIVMAMTRPVVLGGIKVAKLSDEDVPSLLNQRVCRFIIMSNVEPNYLFHYIHHHFFISSVIQSATGSQQPNISSSQIENILIPVPKLFEQKEMADILSSCNTTIYSLEKEISLLDELFRAMLEELMTGRLSAMALVEGNE
ncbi:MAG: restriction endonuclease subunit S [Blastocatellia bacterium]